MKVKVFSFRARKIFISILIFLVLFRIALPFLGKYYINLVLKDGIDGYTGRIEDFDLILITCSYQMQGFVLKKIEDQIPVPFLEAKEIDFSLAWKPLLKGHVVGKVTLDEFKANFVNGATKEQQQTGVEGQGWVETVDDLFPLEIEQLRLINSELHFIDFSIKPKIDLYLKNINATAENLSNTKGASSVLSSKYNLSSTVQEKGKLKILGQFSLLERPQPFDMNLEAEQIDIAQFNNFFRAYGNFDIGQGHLDLYSEIAHSKGKVKGYVKPLLTRPSVLKAANKKDNPATEIDVLASLINLLVRRYSQDQVGAKIPFEGDFSSPEVKWWPTIKSFFQHAFGEALKKKIDQDIDINDVRKGS